MICTPQLCGCVLWKVNPCVARRGRPCRRRSTLQEVEGSKRCILPNRYHCHSLSLAPVNPDWFYLPGSYLSGTCSPGWSRTNSRRAVKRLCVCVPSVLLLVCCAKRENIFVLLYSICYKRILSQQQYVVTFYRRLIGRFA